MPVFQKLESAGVPVKIWTRDIDEAALRQLCNVASLPFVFHHVAAMPDVHVGLGATIGSVIATTNAVIPAAVGVDIGCGMALIKLNLEKSELNQETLEAAFAAILRRTPVGLTQHREKNCHLEACQPFEEQMADIEAKNPGILAPMKTMNWRLQLGTLGSGNHFIEIEVDDEDGVWVMIHSGSRGAGNVMASHFIHQARVNAAEKGIELPDGALSYFEEGEELFADYMQVVDWAQRYAVANRKAMIADVVQSLEDVWPHVKTEGNLIDCRHNYVVREEHFGQSVFVTRKGAIRAGKGELGIIPGSMGAASYLVEGLGNEESFMSSAHGAGRRYGRQDAKRRFTVEDLKRQTEGVVCRKDQGVLDEIPAAYKDIDAVMNNQSDLVKIVRKFRQVLCIKG